MADVSGSMRSTDHTELSRTSVGDFLRLMGDELERASAFLTKTSACCAARPASPQPTQHPLEALPQVQRDAAAAVQPAETPAAADAPLFEEAGQDVAPRSSSAARLERGAHAPLPPPGLPPAAIAMPATTRSAQSDAGAAARRGSASFVRLDQLEHSGAQPASHRSAQCTGPPLPPLEPSYTSQATSSSSKSSNSGSDGGGVGSSPREGQEPRQEGVGALLQQLESGRTAEAQAGSAVAGDATEASPGLEGAGQPSGLGFEAFAMQPQSAAALSAAPQGVDSPAVPAGLARQHLAGPLPFAASSALARVVTAAAQPPLEQPQQGGAGQAGAGAGGRASVALRALQVGAGVDSASAVQQLGSCQARGSLGAVGEVAASQGRGEAKKSHLKVLRWLSQGAGELCSPASPAGLLQALPSNMPATQRLRAAAAPLVGRWHLASPAAPAGRHGEAAGLPPAPAALPQSPGRLTGGSSAGRRLATIAAAAAAAAAGQGGDRAARPSAPSMDYCGQLAGGPTVRQQQRQGSTLMRVGARSAAQHWQPSRTRGLVGGGGAGPGQSLSPLKLLRPRRGQSSGEVRVQHRRSSRWDAESPLPAVPEGPQQWQRQEVVPVHHEQRAGTDAGGRIIIGSVQTAYFGAHGAAGGGGAPAEQIAAPLPLTWSAAAAAAGPSQRPSSFQCPSASAGPGLDVWAAYLASRRAGAVQQAQDDLQGIAPGDTVAQLRSISASIKRMQGEITTFLSSNHAPSAAPITLLPPPSQPNCSPPATAAEQIAGAVAMPGQAAAPSNMQRPGGAISLAKWPVESRTQGAGDAEYSLDDFVMSIKLGTDHKVLQRRATAAAAAGRAPLQRSSSQGAGGGAAAGSRSASAGSDGPGRGGAINRLKGLRAKRGTERVAYDSSVPVVRVGSHGKR